MKKKNALASILATVLLGISIGCEVDNPDVKEQNATVEEAALESEASLTAKGTNCNTKDVNTDIGKPLNHGELDDRTCKHRYGLTTFGTSKTQWGKYEISENSSTDDNSARMERFFAPRVKPGKDTYQYFTGTFRIESVGGGRGTYFAQTKGKHKGSTGDPVLCLYVAKKVVEGGETYFDLYREQVTKRGGKFSDNGRKDVPMTRVKKNENFNVEITTGFKQTGTDSKGNPIIKNFANIKIKGKWYYFDVPDPNLGTEAGIRYGAYSVTSGNAKIYVSNTSFSDK